MGGRGEGPRDSLQHGDSPGRHQRTRRPPISRCGRSALKPHLHGGKRHRQLGKSRGRSRIPRRSGGGRFSASAPGAPPGLSRRRGRPGLPGRGNVRTRTGHRRRGGAGTRPAGGCCPPHRHRQAPSPRPGPTSLREGRPAAGRDAPAPAAASRRPAFLPPCPGAQASPSLALPSPGCGAGELPSRGGTDLSAGRRRAPGGGGRRTAPKPAASSAQ